MRFESVYDPKDKKIHPGKPVTELTRVGNTRKRGTLVRFMPDSKVFEDTRFNGEVISAVCASGLPKPRRSHHLNG